MMPQEHGRGSTPEEQIRNVEQLEELLSEPTQAAVDAMVRCPGDVLVLGVAGKMGPTLARMAKRASEAGRVRRRVIGVARFTRPEGQAELERHGVETIRCDLLDPVQLQKLPDAPNVVFMAGMKFGSAGQEAMTWAMNTYLPGRVCERFHKSRIVVFSTGNVYGLSPIVRGGSVESDELKPIGDYAMSCLGRERLFEHFSGTLDIPVSIIRLNYACELRYGVLVDLARKVWQEEEISLSMGMFNVIWQADANAMVLASLTRASSPPFVLNVTGPEMLGVRSVCEQFGRMMKKPVRFVGGESGDALLNNGQLGHRVMGYPRVSAQRMMQWIADWVMRGGASLGKPTHFEARDGKF
jgi:nucleoside-diphosphate-sugar epimerase